MPVTLPPMEALAQFLAPTTRHTRRVEIYEADGVTRWTKDTKPRLKDGSVTVDYTRDERRALDLTLDNSDDVLIHAPGEFWYDKIIKVYRGVAVNSKKRLPKVLIISDETVDPHVTEFREAMASLGYGDVQVNVLASNYALDIQPYDIIVALGGDDKSGLLVQALHANKSVFVVRESAQQLYDGAFGSGGWTKQSVSASGTQVVPRAVSDLRTLGWRAFAADTKAPNYNAPVAITAAGDTSLFGVGWAGAESTSTTTPAVMAGLTDLFDSADNTKWTFAPNASTVGGQLQMTTSLTEQGITSVNRYTLTGSSVTLKVPTPAGPVASGGSGVGTAIYLNADTNNYLAFVKENNTLYAIRLIGGVQTNVTVATYNATNHVWWRITESGGTITWATSPDGVTWTTYGTWVWSGITLTNLQVRLTTYAFGSVTGLTAAKIDNFNVPVLAIESWTGTDGAVWPSQWTSVTGNTIKTNRGQMIAAGTHGAQQAYLSGMAATTDTDTVVTVLPPTSGEWYATLAARTTAITAASGNAAFPNNGIAVQLKAPSSTSTVPTQLEIDRIVAGTRTAVSSANIALTADATGYKIRLSVQGSTYSVKVWRASDVEPSAWTATYTDATPYSVAGRTWLAVQSGTAATAVTAAWDDLTTYSLVFPSGTASTVTTVATDGATSFAISSFYSSTMGKAMAVHYPLNSTQYMQTDFYNFLRSAMTWLNPVMPLGRWEVQIGEFMIDRISEANFPHEVKITGRDYTKKCMLSKFTQATMFEAGQTLEGLIGTLAANAGIVKKLLPTTGVTIGDTFSFDRNTSRWDAMKQITTAYNYELYFDATGYLTMRPFLDPTTSAPVIWIETGKQGQIATYTKSTSDASLFNHILVTGESSDQNVLPVYAEAINTDPDSPTNVDEIGDRYWEYSSSLITDQQQAQDLADTYLSINSLEEFELDFATLVMPWLEGGDILGFIDPDPAPGDPNTFLLSSFTLPLTLEPMSGVGKRVLIVGV